MENPKGETIFRRLAWLLCVYLWSCLAILIYNTFIEFGVDFRVAVFENYCPPDLAHHWYDDVTPRSWVDWCDTGWWHPFRLFSRLLTGCTAGTLMFLLGRLLVRNTTALCGFCSKFLFLVATGYSIFSAWIEPAMKNYFFHACFRGFDSEISSQICFQQLGRFGDQRFVFPFTVALVFWALSKHQRTLEQQFDKFAKKPNQLLGGLQR